MITGLLLLLPFLAGLLLLITKGENSKRVALATSTLVFIVALVAYFQLKNNPADPNLLIALPWIKSLGISFYAAIDGISMLMVLLTTFLCPLIILSSFDKKYNNPAVFYSLILFMEMALIGVFVAMDGFLFYIFWELALIPIYFICLMWGGENRAVITFKFFIYTLLGSLFMLVGLIYLYQHSNLPIPGTADFLPKSFNINALYAAGRALPNEAQSFVFWAFFLAFAIKMPIFPFHTWQPDTYTTAPTPGTMLLSGIMLKMGTYGLIRWLLPLVPFAVKEWGMVAMVLSVISVVYASIIAIAQKDFKRLIAYSSIAHVGLIAAGIFAFNVQGIQGALIQMVSHGINVVGLFFICDILFTRTGTREMDKMGGIRTVSPQFAVLFLIVLLGSVALPLTNGFVGELLLLNGIFQYSGYAALFAGLTIILGAVYMLRGYQKIMLGETGTLTASFTSLTTNEIAVLIPLVVAIITFGIYPKLLLEIAEPAVQKLISLVGSTN